MLTFSKYIEYFIHHLNNKWNISVTVQQECYVKLGCSERFSSFYSNAELRDNTVVKKNTL